MGDTICIIMYTNNLRKSGFTIVELLVVIVIIGILAAITIVSYTGITQKATAASLQADLANASQKLKIWQLSESADGSFPNTIRCDIPDSATNLCIKTSGSNNLADGYSANNLTTPKTFSLTGTNSASSTSYIITQDTAPVAVTGGGGSGTTLTSVSISAPTMTVGSMLTAMVSPVAATTHLQWQSSTMLAGPYSDIPVANGTTYTLTAGDANHYIKVVANGTGTYTGTVTSDATAMVTSGSLAVSDPLNWMTVGTQVWGKYNLNVGTRIDGNFDQTNNFLTEKYCYNNDEMNCIVNGGGLYQWDEAMQYVATEGAQGICPAGSHIPTDNDWKILEMQLGMTQVQADATGWRGTNQRVQLEIGGSSGLNVPFAGLRNADGSITNLSSDAFLLSSSGSGVNAWARNLTSSESMIARYMYSKAYGFSVRCLGN